MSFPKLSRKDFAQERKEPGLKQRQWAHYRRGQLCFDGKAYWDRREESEEIEILRKEGEEIEETADGQQEAQQQGDLASKGQNLVETLAGDTVCYHMGRSELRHCPRNTGDSQFFSLMQR